MERRSGLARMPLAVHVVDRGRGQAMMKAAIYARKSTAQHVAEDAKSVAHQVARARQFSAQRGWTVVEEHVYVDDAASGAEFVDRDLMRLVIAAKSTPRPFD